MTDVLGNLHKLAEAASKIKTVYSLAALIILTTATVVICLILFPSTPVPIIGAIVMFEVGGFLVLIILARKMPSPSVVPAMPETSESTLERNNLSIQLPIWENLCYCFRQLGFSKLEREKKITILDADYHFSWAESDSAKLLLLQLTPRELSVPNLRKVHSILRIELPNIAGINVTGYIIVCATSNLSDACVEYLENLKEPLKCSCLTNHSLTQIQRKDEIGLTHLRAKLSPCVV